jgi:hypothetical protein
MSDVEQPVADAGRKHLPVYATPFIGRQAEVEAIRARLKETRDGHGGGLAIRAASGIGKTRLAHQAAAEAGSQDMTVVFIVCRGSLHRPYQPITDLVRVLLGVDAGRPAEIQRTQLVEGLTYLDLPDLIPEFGDLLNLPAAQDAPARDAQSHTEIPANPSEEAALTDTLAHLMEGLARRGYRALLIFDDLDQAHHAAQVVLISLAEELVGQPVLLLATFTPDAPERLQMAFGTSVLDLPCLTQEETLGLVTALFEGKGLATGLADRLWAHTAGRPLFTTLLIEHLREAGQIGEDASGQISIAGDVTLFSVEELILKRLDHLPGHQRQLLEYSAVLGDGFRIGALGTLRGQPYSDTLYADLTALVEADWLERTGTARRANYRFGQRLIHETLYESLPSEQRTDLHRRAGDYYAVPSTGRRLRVENATYHYLKIGDVERALTVIGMALTRARQAGDRRQVMALYRRGAEVAATLPAFAGEQTAMAEALGDLYAVEEDYEQAAWAYGELAPASAPAMLLGKLGLVLLAVDPARAASVLTRVSPAAPRAHPGDLYWRVEAGLVWALARSGHVYDAIRRSRDILGSLGETAGFGSARTLLRGTLGMALFYHDDPQEAQPHLESARAGWGARNEQEGIMLINQILIEVPIETITRQWMRFVLRPLIERDGPDESTQPAPHTS